MPYSNLEKRKEYARNYNREYMKSKGSIYRTRAEDKRALQLSQWKEDLYLDYKLRRIQKHYGTEGLRAFERDNFSCAICNEWDIRVLVIHHKDHNKKNNVESNLMTLCNNCHYRIHFSSKNIEVTQNMLDNHFLRIAEYYGEHAKCYSRHVGAVIIDYDDITGPKIISLGRNGPPTGYPHCNINNPDQEEICPRQAQGFKSGEGLHLCSAVHAEVNAINFAARDGKAVEGKTMYLNCNVPCLNCSKSIVSSGIKEVVVTSLEVYEKTGITGKMMLEYGGVKLRIYGFD